MENNLTLNRIHINPEHSLIIHNFTSNDTGLYYCKGLEDQDQENKYNFLTDCKFSFAIHRNKLHYFIDSMSPVVYENNETSFETGNLTAWRKYHEDFFAPINKMLKESKGVEFLRIRDVLRIEIEAVTEWDSWGICEICGRAQGQGRRRRKGFCRLKINPAVTNVNMCFNFRCHLFLLHLYRLPYH